MEWDGLYPLARKNVLCSQEEHGGNVDGLTKHIENDWNLWHEEDGTIVYKQRK